MPPSWAPLKPRKRFRWLTRLHSRDGVIGTVGRAPPFGTHGNYRPSSNPLLASPEADRGKRWSVPRLTYRLLRWVGGRCVFSPKHISSRNLTEGQRTVKRRSRRTLHFRSVRRTPGRALCSSSWLHLAQASTWHRFLVFSFFFTRSGGGWWLLVFRFLAPFDSFSFRVHAFSFDSSHGRTVWLLM